MKAGFSSRGKATHPYTPKNGHWSFPSYRLPANQKADEVLSSFHMQLGKILNKYITGALCLGLVGMLLGCDFLPTAENKAKKVVSASLIDPESARFERMYAGVKKGDFCGFVNGKNRMGGYAGASPFFYEDQISYAEIGSKPPDSDDFKFFHLDNASGFNEKKFIELLHACTFPERWKAICGTDLPGQVYDLCPLMQKKDDSFLKELYKRFDRR